MSSSDPLGVLRSHIEAASAPVPDEGTLLTLLAVENGDPLRAAKLIIDDHRASNRASGIQPRSTTAVPRRRPRPRENQLDFAENEEEYERAISGGRSRPEGGFAADGILGLLYQAISLPFSAVHLLVVGVAKLLRWIRGIGFGSGNTNADADGKLAAKAFVDALKQTSEGEEEVRIPENFLETSYNDALKRTKTELKMLVVILTSNDSRSETFLQTLRSSQALNTLSNDKYLIWGSNTNRKEGQQVSKSLMARQHPFVGCISLRCPPSASGTAAPQLSLISRTSTSLTSHESLSWFINSCYTKCSTTLEVLQAEKHSREMERLLMQEQDRAYEEVSRKDAEKIARRRQEEQDRRREEEEKERLLQVAKEERERRLNWLLSHRDRLQSLDPEEGTQVQAVLPSGSRISKTFSVDTRVEDIFTWIEVSALPSDLLPTGTSSLEDYTHTYEFSLYHGYPRQKLDFSRDRLIRDVAELSPRVQFIVEGRLFFQGENGGKDAEDEDSSGSSDEEE